ncbi:MAG: 16S rRNA (adenine(1518)-N(6)/adenine(1519)-N(6))-dimethyltransferase RsmA [bacterium]|nr:16S rRNA (adenine(1518)-N(6)/adenine(1519)-N(6))-dimethyltransferase RsmA [bacterium]
MRRLGQHFLKNRSAIQKIIGALELKNGETIIEVGPGHGELTDELLASSFELLEKKAGHKIKVIAIEKDPELAFSFELLAFRGKYESQIEIINGDALKILPSLVKSYNLKAKSWKLVGNIPYYITGHLLRVIGELKNKPALCVFTVQKEVAERIAAEPPHTNRLSASVQFWAEPEIIGYISKKDFFPPPAVDSAIIKLETRDKGQETNSEQYYAAVRALFAQPRQTILNNLRRAAIERASPFGRATKLPKDEISKKLKQIKIDPEDRPQNLSVQDIIKISEYFSSTQDN